MGAMQPMEMPEFWDTINRLPLKYAAIAALTAGTGNRISETLSLRWPDIIDSLGHIREDIRLIRLKTRNEKFNRKTIYIPQSLRKYILQYYEQQDKNGHTGVIDYVFPGAKGKPMKRQTVWRYFRNLLGPGNGTHWMRKTFARNVFQEIINENPEDKVVLTMATVYVQSLLGHARFETTVNYLGFSAPPDKKKLLNKVFAHDE